MLAHVANRLVSPAEPVFRRLSALATLSEAETVLLLGLTTTRERWPAEAEIQPQGEPIHKPRVLLSGWACRQRTLSSGRRQIFDFLVPGDLIGACPTGALWRWSRPWR